MTATWDSCTVCDVADAKDDEIPDAKDDNIPMAVPHLPKSASKVCALLRENNGLLRDMLDATEQTNALLANLQANPSTSVLTDAEMQQLCSIDCTIRPTTNHVERLLEVAKIATMIGQPLSPQAREWLVKTAVESVLKE